MADFKVKTLVNGKLEAGVTVEIEYKTWTGGTERHQLSSDSKGEVLVSLGISQTTVNIKASKYGQVDKDTNFINLIGIPDKQVVTLELTFQPLTGVSDTINRIGSAVNENLKWALIAGVVVTAVIVPILAYRYISGAKFVDTAISAKEKIMIAKEKKSDK